MKISLKPFGAATSFKFLNFAIPVGIGIAVYLIVFGWQPLNPQNIAWLDGGFDPSQHYIAWEFFRDAPWSLPLGLNLNYGLEVGSSIVYSDSIPLLAVFFKLISPLLTRPFQYLGLWALICFILQSLSAWTLMGTVTQDRVILSLSSVLFLFAPVFLWRAGEQAALMAQFLVIFSLYLSIRPSNSHRIIYWSSLFLLSSAIQAYFLPMIFLLWSANILSQLIKEKRIKLSNCIFESCIIAFVNVIAMWILGYFVIPGGSTSGLDYGYKQLNLLAMVNPSGWSYIIPSIRFSNAVFEGYSYLGLGLLLMTPVAIFFYLRTFRFVSFGFLKLKYLLVALFLISILAISNRISVGPYTFVVSLPESIFSITSIFRASGRLFWPVYYFIFYCVLLVIYKSFPRKIAIVIISIACLLQAVDTSAGWLEKNRRLNQSYGSTWSSEFRDHFWSEALNYYKTIIEVPLIRNTHDIPVGWSTFAWESARHKIGTNNVYLARYDESKLVAANAKYEAAIASGKYDPLTLYIIDDERVMPALMHLNDQKDLFFRIDGFNVLAPGWVACSSCDQPPKETLIKKSYPKIKIDEPIGFAKGQIGTAFLIGVDQRQIKGWGWAWPESWGVWSEGSKTKVVLPMPAGNPKTLTIDFRAFITAAHPKQTVEVVINNKIEQTVIFSRDQENQITINLAQNDFREYIVIELRLPDAMSPKDLGIGDDIRPLGVGLVRAEFR